MFVYIYIYTCIYVYVYIYIYMTRTSTYAYVHIHNLNLRTPAAHVSMSKSTLHSRHMPLVFGGTHILHNNKSRKNTVNGVQSKQVTLALLRAGCAGMQTGNVLLGPQKSA